MKELKLPHQAEVYTRVTTDKMAVAVGSGSLKVFATPSMCALMEEAACNAVAPLLEEQETTVGIAIQIEHIAPTPQGATVTAEASIQEINGREITLQVTAFDEVGEIGHGTHKRFVVDKEVFQAKADARK